MTGATAWILSRKYTEDSVIGLGAIKGASCVLKSIVPYTAPSGRTGNTLTFEWTAIDGVTKQTQSMNVMDGVTIDNIAIDPTTDHLIFTLSDGTTIDAGKLPSPEPVQVKTMPAANAQNAGKVVQYIGATNANYTHNYFYECVEDTSTSPSTYKWENVNVQEGGGGKADDHWYGTQAEWDLLSPTDKEKYLYVHFTDDLNSGVMVVTDLVQKDNMNPVTSNAVWNATQGGGGGSASLTDALNVSKAVGGITVGTNYPIGTDLEDILRDMLDPVSYPTLTNPSASISATGTKLLETGATLNTTITITFNRGGITPAYGTSGYRAGTATGYVLNGGTSQVTNTFTETVSESNKTFVGAVSYGVGEQPKDSTGADYSTPLPAGSVNTSTLIYEFVDAIWANATTATSIDKQALVSKSTKVKEFNFPATTDVNPEVFDIPASWTVTAVEALNTLSGQWEDVLSQFTVTTTTHDNAASVAVNYNRYTCNLGFDLGARKVRCKWN